MGYNGSDPLEFPPELRSKPLALVGLTGLTVNNNPHHLTIWESFSKNHERSSVLFRLFDEGHQFPSVKPKRSSYEWYMPKGILKRNWMKKHLLEVPAAIVVLFDLDWDEKAWDEKVKQCSAKVDSVRSSLEGRATKLAVILIQKKSTLPPGDDVTVADRAAAVCTACDLNSKFLFILPLGEHLQGCILRLESALYDAAQTYYVHEIKQIKLHKDHLNKTNHQYLFIRHQFKMGYLNELKQELITAQRHYYQAYVYLKELRIVDANAFEIKLIAGFINYKICHLLFKLNQPKDAVTQFRHHIEFYKTKDGQKELLFEHNAWLSRQYFIFAEIFEEVIRMGLTAVQTQHPGYYYKQAAQQTMDRKLSCHSLCSDVTVYPDPDPLLGYEQLEFFGQRPWRPGTLSVEPLKPDKEKLGIQALQFKEKLVDHSGIIISQLGSSIAQFKTYKCPRMRRHLVVMMADEYYSSGDYGKALTLLTHMLWDYRSEKWWALMSTLLSKALSCAYLSANILDYLTLALEALGPSVQLTEDHKTRIFNNVIHILEMTTPDPEPSIPEALVSNASNLWTATTTKPSGPYVIEMNNMESCVEIRTKLTEKQFKSGEEVKFEIWIRYNFHVPIEFSGLAVIINTPNSSSEVPLVTDQLQFETGQVKKYNGVYNVDPADLGKEIQISFILLSLGNNRSLVLKFNAGTGDHDPFQLNHIRGLPADSIAFFNVHQTTTAEMVPPESTIEFLIQHDSPALLGEWFPITVTVNNQDTSTLTDCCLEVALQFNDEDTTMEQSTQFCEDITHSIVQSSLNLKLQSLEPNSKINVSFYMRGHRVGDRTLLLKLNYKTVSVRCKQEKVVIPVIKPFDISTQLLSMKFEHILNCYVREKFLIMPTIQLLSPWPLVFHNSSLDLGHSVKSVDKELKSLLAGVTLYQNETGSDMFALVINEASDQTVALGTYTVQWSRQDQKDNITSCTITLPTTRCDDVLFDIEMAVPSHGKVGQPMMVQYNLYNHGSDIVELNLIMEASDAFMFAGQKQINLRLLPDSKRCLEYNLYPLFSGLVQLPRLTSSTIEQSDKLQLIIERNLQSHVYVIPQEKKISI